MIEIDDSNVECLNCGETYNPEDTNTDLCSYCQQRLEKLYRDFD